MFGVNQVTQVASLTTALAEQRATHAATLAQLDGKEHAMALAAELYVKYLLYMLVVLVV
jgi:hypothetical protein